MKIAYFGTNALSSCLDILVERGHEISCIYTVDDHLYSGRVINYARQNGIELCFERPAVKPMGALVTAGVELFFAAEYPWKIPVPDDLPYGINAHPTLLPEGRGPTPLPALILNNSPYAGISLHKITEQFDKGDILLQKAIALAPNESYETLSARLYLETPPLLDELLSSLDSIYSNSVPQQGGSYWPSLTKSQQTVDWDKTTDVILRQIRAFGNLGVYAEINGQQQLITAAEGVVQSHNYAPGNIILLDSIRLIIASMDGMICIARTALHALASAPKLSSKEIVD